MSFEETKNTTNSEIDDDDIELEGEQRVRMLLNSLKAHQIMIRASASESLADMGIQDQNVVLPLLMDSISGDTDWWTVRFGAVEAIQSMAEAGTTISNNYVENLCHYLKDEDVEFRPKVALALGHCRNKLATPFLLSAMKDKEDETREIVATALGLIGDVISLPVLLEHLTDSSHYVQTTSADAIGDIAKDLTSKFENIESLVNNLDSDIEGVYRSAARALGKIKNQKAVVPLIKSFKNSATTPEGREDILNALKSFLETEILSEIKLASNGNENILLDLIEEAIFQYPFETLIRDSEQRKTQLIGKYKRQFDRMRSEIDTINAFVSDTFKNLVSVKNRSEVTIVLDSIPRKRKNLQKVNLVELEKFAWVKKELYIELAEAKKWYSMGQGALNELEKALQVKLDSIKEE